MTLDEVVSTVLDLTQRPDKRINTIQHVNAIIQLLSMKADFFDDLAELTIEVDPTLYGQSFSLDLLPSFRKFKYIQRTGSKNYVTPIGADKLLTPNNQIQLDRYYIAGTNVTCTFKQLTPTLEIGYYKFVPRLSAALDTNWYLQKMPDCIIDLATARLLQSIGDTEGASTYQQSGGQLFIAAKNDFAEGFTPGAL